MLEPLLGGFASMMFLIAGRLKLKRVVGHRIEVTNSGMDAVPEGRNCCPSLAMELEAEARWRSLAITALAELPARPVQQAVAQLGHPNFSYPAQSRS